MLFDPRFHLWIEDSEVLLQHHSLHEVLLVALVVLDPLAEKILQPDVEFLWRLIRAGLQGSELQCKKS